MTDTPTLGGALGRAVFSLNEIKAIKIRLGGFVNDVVLAPPGLAS